MMRMSGSYCIGFARVLNYNPRDVLLFGSISTQSFYAAATTQRRSRVQRRHDDIGMFDRLHVIQVFYGSLGECYAVLKTRWIMVVQRAWKQVFAERRRLWNLRMHVNCLRERQLTGRYPPGLRYLPGLRGMIQKKGNKNN